MKIQCAPNYMFKNNVFIRQKNFLPPLNRPWGAFFWSGAILNFHSLRRYRLLKPKIGPKCQKGQIFFAENLHQTVFLDDKTNC